MRRLPWIAGAILITGFSGCGGSNKPAAVPMKLSVFHRNQPAAGAFVVFHPVDPAFEKRIGGKPFGYVKDDGSVELTTYAPSDGAPEGEYAITVDWRTKGAGEGKFSFGEEGGKATGPDRLGGRYGNPQQPQLKKSVQKNADIRLDLD